VKYIADRSTGIPGFSTEFMPIIDWLEDYAATKGATPPQIALAWLMAKSPIIVPIPGNEAHLLENLGAQNVKLSAADVQAIDTLLSKFPVYGDRMGRDHMLSIDCFL
jgi:aryl-alcohol dehydrogenase-like predicted oxidoreductase